MKRSLWFNARTQPPVNGGDDAVYEHICPSLAHSRDMSFVMRVGAKWIKRYACVDCQWRGLLREENDGKA